MDDIFGEGGIAYSVDTISGQRMSILCAGGTHLVNGSLGVFHHRPSNHSSVKL